MFALMAGIAIWIQIPQPICLRGLVRPWKCSLVKRPLIASFENTRPSPVEFPRLLLCVSPVARIASTEHEGYPRPSLMALLMLMLVSDSFLFPLSTAPRDVVPALIVVPALPA